MFILILIFVLSFANHAICQEDGYDLRMSTIEVVDRDGDRKKEGLEIFYIFKKEKKYIELESKSILRLEAYLYEDRDDKVLISFWQIDDLEKTFFNSIIYLPFKEGFAYNIYMDKIIKGLLKIKIVFRDGRETEAQIKDRLSFLVY